VIRIRDALHPRVFAGVTWEVYHLRNVILKKLMQCKAWPSHKAKYEALRLVVTYWSYESHSPGQVMRTSASSSVQSEAVHPVQPGVGSVETDDMRTLLVQLQDILPEDFPFDDEPVWVGEELCLPSEWQLVCESICPKCHMSYDDHCD
jgi:hypothetical protein